MQHFNQLSPAEAERLALLAEECAEIIQAVGKILRHGYESVHPASPEGPDNRRMLETEIGDLTAVIRLMLDAEDLNYSDIVEATRKKERRVPEYLHHQES